MGGSLRVASLVRQRLPTANRLCTSAARGLKVDSEAHAATAGLFGVTGYPTLKWMPKGKMSPKDAETVNAARSADGLAKWITKKTGVLPNKPAEVRAGLLACCMIVHAVRCALACCAGLLFEALRVFLPSVPSAFLDIGVLSARSVRCSLCQD